MSRLRILFVVLAFFASGFVSKAWCQAPDNKRIPDSAFMVWQLKTKLITETPGSKLFPAELAIHALSNFLEIPLEDFKHVTSIYCLNKNVKDSDIVNGVICKLNEPGDYLETLKKRKHLLLETKTIQDVTIHHFSSEPFDYSENDSFYFHQLDRSTVLISPSELMVMLLASTGKPNPGMKQLLADKDWDQDFKLKLSLEYLKEIFEKELEDTPDDFLKHLPFHLVTRSIEFDLDVDKSHFNAVAKIQNYKSSDSTKLDKGFDVLFKAYHSYLAKAKLATNNEEQPDRSGDLFLNYLSELLRIAEEDVKRTKNGKLLTLKYSSDGFQTICGFIYAMLIFDESPF